MAIYHLELLLAKLNKSLNKHIEPINLLLQLEAVMTLCGYDIASGIEEQD